MSRNLARRPFLRSLGVGATTAVLAACGMPPAATITSEAVQPSQAAAAAQASPAAGGLPIVRSPLALTYWATLPPTVSATLTSFGDMSMYKELEKRTGIQLEFQHPPTGTNQAQEQISLMIAAGTYPAVIEGNLLAVPGGPARAISDGVVLRLNDLIDQHAPNLAQVLRRHPEWRKQISTDEGDIYCFPFLRGDPALLVFTGITIRQDWLEKVGLRVPTTINQWDTVLRAFKGNDLNGNGAVDEWPFSPWMDNQALTGFNRSHAFVGAWGITTGFYQDDGLVKYGPYQPEYREFLGTMAAWYQEGLIDPDSVMMDQQAYDAKMTGGLLGASIMRIGSGMGKFAGLMKDKDPHFKLIAAPYPTLKAGETPVLGQRDNIYPGSGSAAISTSNQHVVETVKLLDYAYSPEGHLLYNFGIHNLSYTLENGYPKFSDLVMNNPDKLPVAQAMAQHCRSNFGGPFEQDKRYIEQYFALPEQREAYNIWSQPATDKLLPPLTPTRDESRRFAMIMTEVGTRHTEMFAKVLTGTEPIEVWDIFVDEIKQLGIDEALQMRQAALNRYTKRT